MRYRNRQPRRPGSIFLDDTIAWLRDRPYYDGQVQLHQQRPGRNATFRDIEVRSRLAGVFTDNGIDRFYDHQAAAIETVCDSRNTVLATRTTGGKSLVCTIPAFERRLADNRCTLYIAPQVALINDQAEILSELVHGLGFDGRVRVDQYTGYLSKSQKRDVRDRQPTVLLTTPAMFHYGILPHARRLWDWFVRRLDNVVIAAQRWRQAARSRTLLLQDQRIVRASHREQRVPWTWTTAVGGMP